MGSVNYNYEDKSCTFEILNPEWNSRKTFDIKDILYMEAQQCEFTGPGHIFCVDVMMKNLPAQKNYIREK